MIGMAKRGKREKELPLPTSRHPGAGRMRRVWEIQRRGQFRLPCLNVLSLMFADEVIRGEKGHRIGKELGKGDDV